MIIDGQVAARWRRVRHDGLVAVEIQPLRALAEEEQAALGAEVARYGRFVGQPATLRWAGVAAEAAY